MKFRFFTLNLIQKRKYNKSEDLLIRGKRDREMSIVKNYKPNKCLSLGWAAGALAASSLNDYGEPADEKQLLDIYAGNARVQR